MNKYHFTFNILFVFIIFYFMTRKQYFVKRTDGKLQQWQTTTEPVKQIKLDKIYYINMDRRPDRKKHFLDQCKKEKINMNLVERFKGIDGKTLKLTKEEEKLFKNADYKHTPYFKNIAGNQLSHYYILQDMIKKNYNFVLILQDDVVFKKDFTHYLEKVLSNLPNDAEIINLGLHKYAVNSNFIPLNLESQENKIDCEKSVNDATCIIKDHLNPCSLAYILTRKGAYNIHNYTRQHGFLMATDHNYNHYLKSKGINYASKIVLCTGALMGSDIFT